MTFRFPAPSINPQLYPESGIKLRYKTLRVFYRVVELLLKSKMAGGGHFVSVLTDTIAT